MGISTSGLNQAVATELRAARAALQISLADLSQSTEISARTLQRILAGQTEIELTALARISTALGVETQQVLHRAEERTHE